MCVWAGAEASFVNTHAHHFTTFSKCTTHPNQKKAAGLLSNKLGAIESGTFVWSATGISEAIFVLGRTLAKTSFAQTLA